jgi:aldehyde dehydrogenase (NAD+)
MPFDDEAQPIALANGTDYRPGRRRVDARTARASCALRARSRAGQVFVNNYGAGGGVELPFGGVKHSGHGREKDSRRCTASPTLKTVVLRH